VPPAEMLEFLTGIGQLAMRWSFVETRAGSSGLSTLSLPPL
jgi:hypothetical protein